MGLAAPHAGCRLAGSRAASIAGTGSLISTFAKIALGWATKSALPGGALRPSTRGDCCQGAAEVINTSGGQSTPLSTPIRPGQIKRIQSICSELHRYRRRTSRPYTPGLSDQPYLTWAYVNRTRSDLLFEAVRGSQRRSEAVKRSRRQSRAVRANHSDSTRIRPGESFVSAGRRRLQAVDRPGRIRPRFDLVVLEAVTGVASPADPPPTASCPAARVMSASEKCRNSTKAPRIAVLEASLAPIGGRFRTPPVL